jgi:hypothetical protein
LNYVIIKPLKTKNNTKNMPLKQSSEKFTNTKEFLRGLKGVDFKMKETKAGMLNSLDNKGGYKLTKGEALYRAGKLKSVEEMENAAAYSLDEQDIEGFLDQYGGDKYVKKVFVYGVSKMKRDLLMREMNFEQDKEKGGSFAGLKNYATFQEAFTAGFYKKDFNLSYESIMEKGLSVSEYRQRNKRLRNLKRKVAREEAKEAAAKEAAPQEKAEEVKRSLPPELQEEADKKEQEVIQGPDKKLEFQNKEQEEQKVEPTQREQKEIEPKNQFKRESLQKAKKLLSDFYVSARGDVIYPKRANGRVLAKMTTANTDDTGFWEWDGKVELKQKELTDKLGTAPVVLDKTVIKEMKELVGIKERKEQAESPKKQAIIEAYSKLKEIGQKVKVSDSVIKVLLGDHIIIDADKKLFGDIGYFSKKQSDHEYLEEFLRETAPRDVLTFGFFVQNPSMLDETKLKASTAAVEKVLDERDRAIEKFELALRYQATSDPEYKRVMLTKDPTAYEEGANPTAFDPLATSDKKQRELELSVLKEIRKGMYKASINRLRTQRKELRKSKAEWRSAMEKIPRD